MKSSKMHQQYLVPTPKRLRTIKTSFAKFIVVTNYLVGKATWVASKQTWLISNGRIDGK
jgi:hypothetical protein